MENVNPILNGCICHDPSCQKIIYERYRGYALKIVFRYIYQYEKALDVVTDGFVKMFNNFSKFEVDVAADNERKFMGWLKRIMINTSIDELRKSNLIPVMEDIPEYAWEMTDNNYDADKQVTYNELVALIKKLPTNYNAVFNLYVIDGYNHIEIAEMLNMSVGTSKSNLSRARALLQKQLKNLEESLECRIQKTI